jgi:cell division control protein 11
MLKPRKLSRLFPRQSVPFYNPEIEESGLRLSLTIIDTPGFGININNENSFQSILGFIEHQYDEILAEESRIKRNPKFQDNRVHAVLYFIQPSGHSYLLLI